MEMQNQFIRDKVAELGVAIFYNVSDNPNMITNSLVSFICYDEEGRLYFFISRPLYLMQEDIRFPAVLDFYRKGQPYFIKINGIAELLTEKDEIKKIIDKIKDPSGLHSHALVRLAINKAEYTVCSVNAGGFFNHLKAALLSIF